MDVSYEFEGQAFEWNAQKAAMNLAKHGVAFETASEAFFDPFVRWLSAEESTEPREAIIGYAEGAGLLFVVHTLRQASVVRIISARRATLPERRVYEEER